ncbi:unnamed protein product [Clonostachys rosea]|uniref:Acetoacetate decarboxylase n=1 Tax=Bionectria ochroleuca TaxID=29856 RepID=A0ABY6V4T0_BIOOC|nr:unnamed protein product [Clonostachys rosea]
MGCPVGFWTGFTIEPRVTKISQDPYASNITMVTISYRVTVSSICELVPDMLELDDEPLVTTRFIHYGSSTVGPYSELVHQVEVTYQGEKFDYNLILILDNEAAVFLGREKFGFPKVLGKINIQTTENGRYTGGVEKPVDQPLMQFEFTQQNVVSATTTRPKKWMLNMRCIPSPFCDTGLSIKELVPTTMDMEFSEIGLGTGKIYLQRQAAAMPWAGMEILKYEGAFLVRNATARLYAIEKSRLS